MAEHFIPGKDASLEASIARMQSCLEAAGFHVEERSWLNPVAGLWSVHVAERDCPLLFSNGKGGSRLAALASALGEFIERAASKSSISGRAYQVRCPGQPVQPAASWFRTKLDALRGSAASAR